MAHSPMADQNGCALYQSTHGLWPLEQLQAQHALTMLLRTVWPPCAFGIT